MGNRLRFASPVQPLHHHLSPSSAPRVPCKPASPELAAASGPFLLAPPKPSIDRLQSSPPHFIFRACPRLQSLLPLSELSPTFSACSRIQSFPLPLELLTSSRLSGFLLQNLPPHPHDLYLHFYIHACTPLRLHTSTWAFTPKSLHLFTHPQAQIKHEEKGKLGIVIVGNKSMAIKCSVDRCK